MYKKLTPEQCDEVINELKERRKDKNEFVLYICGDFDSIVKRMEEFDKLFRKKILDLIK